MSVRQSIFAQLDSIRLIDPHSHINPHAPAAENLVEILGYHYYTELAHSAGVPKAMIECPNTSAAERVGRIFSKLGPLTNTAQYGWFVDIARNLLGYDGDLTSPEGGAALWQAATAKLRSDHWEQEVLDAAQLDAVFLTNDFDDPLEGFDTSRYIPCLRTDDLVFHLAKPQVRERLEKATGVNASAAGELKTAIGVLFEHFTDRGAKACAISLPPDFAPTRVSEARAATALTDVIRKGEHAADNQKRALAHFVFWSLAEFCAEFALPFDLMIGVNRGVYEGGVHQGQDLYDSRVSLLQYRQLLNAFPQVTFPISVLASVTNQELVSYAWIFPNVVAHGHWWYSNTPSMIERDLAARLEAIPRNKIIGYYSDMYKLEFALPKFRMFKQALAKVLAERFVEDRGWSEEEAVQLGREVLRTNVERTFKLGEFEETRPAREASYGAAAQALREQPDHEASPAIDEANGTADAGEAPVLETAETVDADEDGAFAAEEAPDEQVRMGVDVPDIEAPLAEEPPPDPAVEADDPKVERFSGFPIDVGKPAEKKKSIGPAGKKRPATADAADDDDDEEVFPGIKI